jgi:hypothetical protein
MTEEEWLSCSDPTPMLESLRPSGKASERKLRLFACACCRRIWDLLTDDRSRKAVELAERAADHPVSANLLDSVSGGAEEAFEDAITDDREDGSDGAGIGSARRAAACSAASYASNSPVVRVADALEVIQAAADATVNPDAERAAQATILRDIFGNPFRQVGVDPSWLAWNGGLVPVVAGAIYVGRAFHRLPVLAGVLEEAGCSDADILAHCHGPGPHFRGCWVVDLLLGKG